MNISDATNSTVSIIIPVYNGANYLKEAIDSTLSQTYDNIEVIVINDGSTDEGETEKIALSYGDKIRYFWKSNGGVASALNMGIKEMRGEYVSWLSHDDVFYPDKIASQISFLHSQTSPEIILYGDYDVINSQSEIIEAIDLIDPPQPRHMRFALTVRYPIHGCTTLIPRRCFERGGMFNEELRTTQDYELWFRFAKIFPFVHQPKRLIHSRRHEAQGTVTMNCLHMREVDELLSKFVHEIDPTELVEASGKPLPNAYAYIADSYHMRGCYSAAFHAIRYAFRNIGTLSLVGKCKLSVRLLLMEVKGSIYSIFLKTMDDISLEA